MKKNLLKETKFMMERLENPRMTDTELRKKLKQIVKEDNIRTRRRGGNDLNMNQNNIDQLDDLQNEVLDILKAMDSFCQKATMIYDIKDPEDYYSVESEKLSGGVGYVAMMSEEFEKLLDKYY